MGRLFENSVMSFAPNFLGNHFSPLLLALVPVYAVWSDPRALLLLQTLALASAVLPLYWYTRAQSGHFLAFALGLAYLLSAGLQYVNLSDFHEIALATPLLAFAIFFLLRQRYLSFAVCLALALLTKEEVAFIAIAFGLYLLLSRRHVKWGLATLVSAVGWTWYIFSVGMPHFRAGEFYHVSRYAYLGASLSEIIQTIFTRPDIVLLNLVAPAKIEFVLHVLVPLAFLPLFGVEIFALAIPTFGYLLLSDNTNQFSIRTQYTAPLLPMLFFASAVAARRIFARGNNPRAIIALAVILLAASGISYYLHAPGPLTRNFQLERYLPNSHIALGHDLIQRLPTESAVLAQTNFVPHLSQRARVFAFPDITNLRDAEYILFDQKLPILTTLPLADFQFAWNTVLDSPQFETIHSQEGYVLRKRAALTILRPLDIQFDNGITLIGYTSVPAGDVRRGDTIQLVLTWRADRTLDNRYVIFIHLLDSQKRIWAQDDREPANGWLRTDLWNSGDVTADRYVLELDSAMPPGDYQITVGLYAVDGQARANARDATGKSLGDEPGIGDLNVK